MRILHLSSYDQLGGAAKAAYRLHSALVEAGEDSLMLVRRKDSTRADVLGPAGLKQRLWSKLQRRVEKLLVAPRTSGEFSVGSMADGLAGRIRELRPDIVHVHWVAHGFLRLETLAALGVPVVWTMHDMWPFTGGCHYSGSCTQYSADCGRCPLLAGGQENDASRQGVIRRKNLLRNAEIQFVAPSQWLADCARASTVLATADVRVIPNVLDVNRFSPRNRAEMRRRFGLPEEGRMLLAGAMAMDAGSRKGGQDFYDAAACMTKRHEDHGPVYFAVFGTRLRQRVVRDGMTIYELGYIEGESAMADVYAAADIFVIPSQQDNLPNTAMEALAVGTPVVGYRVGGIPDMVQDGVNGLLAAPGDVAGLARAMALLLNDPVLWAACSGAARESVVRRYSPQVVTSAYRALYSECGGRT